MKKIIESILGVGASKIIDSSSKLIDGLTTSDNEKSNAKNQLSKIVLEALKDVQNQQKEIIIAEAKGNFLQRSWRPIAMLSFTFIVVYAHFIEPAFMTVETPVIDKISPYFWSLLKLGFGGYVMGRSAEKVAETVTKNIDLQFLKKKDRKL